MQENLARFGTDYRWTCAQNLRSAYGSTVDYGEISKRFLENGALELCQSCTRRCKIPAPSLPVRFVCYDYLAGEEPTLIPSEKPLLSFSAPLSPSLKK